MEDTEILRTIGDLMRTERDLRAKVASGQMSSDAERERLASIEESLDQCWDLLRQRRARREYGEDPDQATARDPSAVEGYLQ